MSDARFLHVLGVDPGVTTGLVVIKVDRQRSKWALISRTTIEDVRDGAGLYYLNRAVRSIVGDHTDAYFGIAMEQLMAFKTSAQEKSEAQGVVRLAAYECRSTLYTYAPNTVRSIVVGSGKAKASDIQKVTRELTGLTNPPKGKAFNVHQQDALAAALCCCVKEDLLKMIEPCVPEADLVPSITRQPRKKEDSE